MKKIILLIITIALLAGLFSFAAMAEEKISSELLANPATFAEAAVAADASVEDEKMELLASVVQTVECYRVIYLKGSNASPVYLYRSPTTTTYLSGVGDLYKMEVYLHCRRYYVLSDGSIRYEFSAKNGMSGEMMTYYVPLSNKVSVYTTYHTINTVWEHPHTRSCACGFLEYPMESSCVTCYPSKIVYDANGGIGAPASESVTKLPHTLSSTIPTNFPKSFSHWSQEKDPLMGALYPYYAGQSISPAANVTITLYAHWWGPVSLEVGNYNYEESIFNPGGKAYFSFVPTETNTYIFESNTDGDTVCVLLDANGSVLASDDQSGTGSNFRLEYTFTADTQYYFEVSWRDTATTGSINVSLNQEHTLTYDANGGTAAPAAQKFMQSKEFTLSTDIPVRDGMQFAGWAFAADAQTPDYLAGAELAWEEDLTLYAVWTYPSGTCGETATWRIQNNTLYIEGAGSMYAYSAGNKAPWAEHATYIQEIQVEEGITTIGAYAFSDCSLATRLELPNSLSAIGGYAFYGCRSLREVSLPAGITAIETYTFAGCVSLTTVSLPQNLKSIGAYAFYDSGVQAMALPASVRTLGVYVFTNCDALQSIQLPSGITSIPNHAFEGCRQLKQISIPNTVQTIGEMAFSNCVALTEVVVPNSVTAIKLAAFNGCTSLSRVTISDSVTEIGALIFATITDKVTIRCYANTPIHQYAITNSIAYELMSWGVLEAPVITCSITAEGANVSISAARGSIYYTTDGSKPTDASVLYQAPLLLQKNCTIKAIAICEGWDNSAVTTYNVSIPKVEAPTPSIPSGSSVLAGTTIALYSATEGADIWYTTNGEMPTAEDVYTGPITITEPVIVYALAVKDGMLNSALVNFNYSITVAKSEPVVTTLEATNITHNCATVSAKLDSHENVTSVQFVYYAKNNSKVRYTVEADENDSAVLTGLTPNTEYWFLAKAVNDVGWGTGHICSFMTEPGEDSKPMSITLNPTYLALNKGKSKTILATVLPLSADNRAVYWSSEDASVATVDANGTVTAVGLGNTRIKATTVSNRLVAYCNVDVISTDITGTFDFSEHNMITNSSYYDEHGYSHGVNVGGNSLMASAYLARWDGAVQERNDPYPSGLSSVKYKEVDAEYHVQNILYLPYRADSLDNDEIKSAVMKYGAVYTAFKVNYSYFSNNKTNYYLPANVNSYVGGHAIVIVGWDDNYSRAKFATTAPGNGAFICKNSWGTSSGENGYFYISYYDKFIARSICGDMNAVFYDLQSVNNYQKIYQYDYLGPVASATFGSKKAYVTNVFPEKGNALKQDEVLEAVAFYNNTPGTSYDVYVVENYVDKTSLRNLGDPVVSGMLEYAGYFTIDLEKAVQLKAGSRFAVVVQYHSPGSSTTVFLEMPVTIRINGAQVDHSANARANADESYLSNDGKSWTDSTSWSKNTNVCVKAFTSTGEDMMQLQGVDNLNRYYEDDTVYTVKQLEALGYQFNPEFVTQFEEDNLSLLDNEDEVNFGAMAPSVLPDLNTNNNYSEGAALPARYDLREEGCMTPVKNQGDIGSCWAHATYASMESAIKKASATSSSLSSDGLSQAGSDATNIELSHDGMILPQGNTQQLIATLLPYGNMTPVLWSSSNNQVASVSAHGLVTTHGVGNAYITASTSDGTVTAKCSVTVTAAEKLRFITIDNLETQLTAGDSLLMEYSLYPSNAVATELVWSVDDSSVASINDYGLLTAHRAGKVTVRVSTVDGVISTEHSITVIDSTPAATVEITASTLTFAGSTLSGNLTVTTTNHLPGAQNGMILVAFYTSQGQLYAIANQNVMLQSGENTVSFSGISLNGLNTDAVTLQIFVLETDGYYPLANPCIETIAR